MNAKEAAVRVLQKEREPLHVKKIARLAGEYFDQRLKNPEGAISNALNTEVKKKGTLIYKARLGVFGLRDSEQPDSTTSVLTFLKAAERVLKEFGQGQPMHYREITRKADEKGWVKSKSETPENIMYSQLWKAINDAQHEGEVPQFVSYGRGQYGLSEWEEQGFRYDISRNNKRVRDDLLKRVKNLSPRDFELLIGQLLAAMGFEVEEVTPLRNDGGIDVRATLVVADDAFRTKMAIQVKRWGKQNVTAPVVREVRGALEAQAQEQGMIITTSGFSPGAKSAASAPGFVPISLIDGEKLARLLAANNIGVKRSSLDVLESAALEGFGEELA